MLHTNRRWCIDQIDSAETLARRLTATTLCGCAGFQIGRYFWLNDSTSPDGAQEFAVVRFVNDGVWIQLESITFRWNDYAKTLELILATLNGQDDRNSWRKPVQPRLETRAEHGRCPLCV
jgi:hypothetical protein